MVAQTSFQAHQPGTKKRVYQADIIFHCIMEYLKNGNYPCAPEISNLTGIRLTTVHGRICDLKKGYEYEGTTYYAVKSGTVTIIETGKRSTSYANWTLTDKKQSATQEDVERIEKQIRILFAKRRAYKLEIQRQLKTLFDQ
jgi:hypothetical protein